MTIDKRDLDCGYNFENMNTCNRMFSSRNLTPKLNKLPELASNLRRKMSDHIKTKDGFNMSSSFPSSSSLSTSTHTEVFLETPEDSDHEGKRIFQRKFTTILGWI